MSSKSKIILCGYHWTGCRALEHLLDRPDVADIAVFTHENTTAVPDIREIAQKNKVWCSIENISRTPLPFSPDIIASVYYRNIIKKHIIEACNGRIFNMHPSLLPRHRGCSSVPWAIIEGDAVTGVTFHYVDEGVDTGKIILQTAMQIAPDETQSSLFQRCIERGMEFWPAALELVKAGYAGAPQSGTPTFHKRGCPYDGEIQDDWPLDRVERFIRAMIFPPYPCAKYKGVFIQSFQEYLELSGRRPA